MACGIELQWPLPTQDELADYYDKSFASGMYQEFAAAEEMKQMTAEQRIKEIERVIPIAGRWLDVGCANGVFVEAIGRRVNAAEGIELAQPAVQSGRDRGLKLHLGTIDDLPPDEKFDCITAFDVLEHVIDPNQFLVGIRERLNEGGHAILTVPNTGGIVRRIMGPRWYFYIPEEHLHYFSRRNLTSLLQDHGFEIDDVGATHKPMTYDYALTQFAEYNPLIYKLLKMASRAIPSGLRRVPIPLPIGEFRVIARKSAVTKVQSSVPSDTRKVETIA